MKPKLPKKTFITSGQALLLVLVGMGAAMVLVLSIVSRSITDISLSSKEDEASRAFSAAEAGIEKLLIGESFMGEISLGNNSFVQGEKTDIALGKTTYVVPEGITSGSYATIWFVGHNDTDGSLTSAVSDITSLRVCWGNEKFSADENSTPALELSVYYDNSGGNPWVGTSPDFSGIKVRRYAFDPNIARSSNGFEKDGVKVTCVLNGQTFPFSKTVLISGIPAYRLFARAKLLYNDIPQSIGFEVVGDDDLPSQGKRLVSTGTSGGDSGSTRKIEVQQTWKDVLPFMDNVLYSGEDIIH